MRARRRVLAGMAAVLVAGLAFGTADASAAPPTPHSRAAGAPKPQDYPEVPVQALADVAATPTVADTAVVAPEVPVGSFDVPVDAAAVAGDFAAVADTGLEVAAGPAAGSAPASAAPSAPVHVEVLDPQTAAGSKAHGLAIRVSSQDNAAVTLRVPDSVVAGAFGADYAQRVQWVTVTGDGNVTAAKSAEVQTTTTEQPAAATQVSAVATQQGVVLAAVSGPTSSNGSGSFGATSLSASSSWQVGNTGGFSWSYPLTAPPATGPAPAMALSYESGSVDSRTGLTNNQVGVVGEGWDLAGGGFIERSYTSCSQDGQASSFDQCWLGDNATVSFGGHSGTLVKDTATGVWRLQTDDGTKVEKLTGASNGDNDGEYWKVTTTDGTQYFFGQNRLPGWTTGKPRPTRPGPCRCSATTPANRATSHFAVSSCTQALAVEPRLRRRHPRQRHVALVHQETNKYAPNGDDQQTSPTPRRRADPDRLRDAVRR